MTTTTHQALRAEIEGLHAREPVDLEPLRSAVVQDKVDRQDRHCLRHMDDHTLEITTETAFESLGFARSRYLAHKARTS